MDLSTLIGIVSGAMLVLVSILMGGSAAIFVHIPSMLMVFGGAIAATLISYKLKHVTGVMGVLQKTLKMDVSDNQAIVEKLTELARLVRREGALALDEEVRKIEDPFMRGGLEMVIDGSDSDTVRDIMELELSYLMERHKLGQGIFNALGMYAPAFGMIGTLVGLIAMLQQLEDPSNIGGGMAVALITTFYGALGSNLIFIPLAKKLKTKSDEEVVIKEMIIEGVLSIQRGDHPNNVSRKLYSFLPPNLRAGSAANAEAAGVA